MTEDICFVFQYYEMSYGLNIEMHKQVGTIYNADVSTALHCNCTLLYCTALHHHIVRGSPNVI